jgi:hypothetical protein
LKMEALFLKMEALFLKLKALFLKMEAFLEMPIHWNSRTSFLSGYSSWNSWMPFL